jgi:hypothetical protein
MGTTINGCCKVCKDDKTVMFEQNLSNENYNNNNFEYNQQFRDSDISQSLNQAIRSNIEMLKQAQQQNQNDISESPLIKGNFSKQDMSRSNEKQLIYENFKLYKEEISEEEDSYNKNNKNFEGNKIETMTYKQIKPKPISPTSAQDTFEISKYKTYQKILQNKTKIINQNKDQILIEGKFKKPFNTGVRHLINYKDIYIVITIQTISIYKSKEHYISMAKSVEVIKIENIIKIKLIKNDLFSLDYINSVSEERNTIELICVDKSQYQEVVSLIYFLIQTVNN